MRMNYNGNSGNLILLTRPYEYAKLTKIVLLKRRIRSISYPILKINYVSPTLLLSQLQSFNYDLMLCTSQSAVSALKNCFEDWRNNHVAFSNGIIDNLIRIPCLVVGNKTCLALQKIGVENVIATKPNIEEALRFLTLYVKNKKSLLYLSGFDTAKDIEYELGKELNKKNKINIVKLITYSADPITQISATLWRRLINGNFSHILFYSPRTAEIFCDLMMKKFISTIKGLSNHNEKLSLNSKAICISYNTASILTYNTNIVWEKIVIAPEPNELSMLNLI